MEFWAAWGEQRCENLKTASGGGRALSPMSEWRAHVNCRHGETRALATERTARKHAGCKRDRDSLANERRRVALRTENKARKTLACHLASERCVVRAAQLACDLASERCVARAAQGETRTDCALRKKRAMVMKSRQRAMLQRTMPRKLASDSVALRRPHTHVSLCTSPCLANERCEATRCYNVSCLFAACYLRSRQ